MVGRLPEATQILSPFSSEKVRAKAHELLRRMKFLKGKALKHFRDLKLSRESQFHAKRRIESRPPSK